MQGLHDRPHRLVDVVRQQIEAAILSGTLPAGAPLSVPELSRQLDVSRGSVREAVLQLVADDLAEERPRRGVVVATIGSEEIRQIHEMREVLEGQAARLCAELGSAALCQQLDDTLAKQRNTIDAADATGYADTDSHFHTLLAASCGNPRLAKLIERLHTQMQIALDRVAEAAEHRCLGHVELQAVADAVQGGDGDAAEKAMRAHIKRTRQAIKRTPEESV